MVNRLVASSISAASSRAVAPDELRRRQLAVLTDWAIAGAKDQSLVLVFQDLHWADPTTLQVLRALAERGALASCPAQSCRYRPTRRRDRDPDVRARASCQSHRDQARHQSDQAAVEVAGGARWLEIVVNGLGAGQHHH